MFKLAKLLAIVVLAFSMVPAAQAHPVASSSPSCVPAGDTGLTTLIVAKNQQHITDMTIDATGCDVGIFVPPDSKNVVIRDDEIFGANIHAIFVQDSTHILIDHNNVHDNSVGVQNVTCDRPHEGQTCVNEGKAIQLDGTSHSLVSHNVITKDLFGGISIADDGPVDPGAPNPGTLLPANDNLVLGNQISQVSHDCGIVVAAYNGQTISDNKILNNNIEGSLPPFGVNPYVGQIVVATDGPDAHIENTMIVNNVINGSTLPGIVLHANAPGDSISGTKIISNTLGNNGYYPAFFSTPNTPVATDGPTGISIVAEVNPQAPVTPPTISGTVLINNEISPDQNGVWLCNTSGTDMINTPNHQSDVTNPVAKCAAGGN